MSQSEQSTSPNKKLVRYTFEFEYSEEDVDDFSDNAVEQLAFETLSENIYSLARGDVESIQ